MRKKSNRVIRPISRPLPLKQYRSLVLQPRIGLELLREGIAERRQWIAVIGFFNLGIALAYLAGDNDFVRHTHTVQNILVALDPDDNQCFKLPEGEPCNTVVAVFNAIDDYLKTQTVPVIEQALVYINKALDGQESSADVVTLAELLLQAKKADERCTALMDSDVAN
jgi:hypothetical protein